jgi:hypothetical protein
VSQPVVTAVTYWSRDLGPYLWHEFDAERTRHDLQLMAHAGVPMVRTLLPWDVFMPAVSRPDAKALRNLEILLTAAETVDMRVIPVLFAQALGDCIALPPYAIDVDASRPGVRAVSGGVVQPGGPRDQYTDPRMLEAELRWIEGLLAAFAGNPAIAMWDLGHDPATVMRPRRIEHLRSWAATLVAQLRDAGERSALTLGVRDVTTARGVRLDAVAAVDTIGIAVDDAALDFARGPHDGRGLAFLAQLALALAGAERPLHAHLSVAHDEGLDTDARRRLTRDAVDRLIASGCAGVHALAWSDCSERMERVAPFDRRPQLAHRGVVDVNGERTGFGDAWLQVAAAAPDAHAPAPWPERLDSADYYANLPHSIEDLFAAWQRDVDD